jgi:DNA-binding transcriptional LysR family regulator
MVRERWRRRAPAGRIIRRALRRMNASIMMEHMSEIDWSALDVRLLRLLVAVVDTGSITGAAARLGVTQSSVSHRLVRLRAITGDPLVVPCGRGIVATARAELLAVEARALLRSFERFARFGDFDPARWHATVTIAANDFQRDLLLPGLAALLRREAPGLTLAVVPSGVPHIESLRRDHHQLVISPRPPDGTDVLQRKLFEDRYRVFFDPSARAAPRSRAEYLAAAHATVVYEDGRGLALDQHLADRGVRRRFAVTVPGFAAVPAFLRGGPLLSTAPGLLAHRTFAGLASIKPPVPCPRLPMYLIWHARYQDDAAHRWLRERILAGAAPALGAERRAHAAS